MIDRAYLDGSAGAVWEVLTVYKPMQITGGRNTPELLFDKILPTKEK